MEMTQVKGTDNRGFQASNEALDEDGVYLNVLKDEGDKGSVAKEEHLETNNHVVVATQERETDLGQDLVFEKKKMDDSNKFAKSVMRIQQFGYTSYDKHETLIWTVIGIILLLLYLAYVVYAMTCEFGDEPSLRLLICTLIGLCILGLYLLRHFLEPVFDVVNNFLSNPKFVRPRRIIRWVLYLVSIITTVTLIIVVVALDDPENLRSLGGLAAFIILCFITSHNPAMVNWHPIFWGFSLQFYFGIIILKTRWGYDAFNWLGDRVTEFLTYSDEGAKFVFSDESLLKTKQGQIIEFTGAFAIHFFAFKLMPVITFFSTVIAILYYFGVMQAVVKLLGRFLSFCLGTTPAESLNAAGNIFVGMTESPLMIRPFIATMTSSELHAVMTGGFATIAGSVLGAYIGFGVPADHLLSASVMSAPAALAISKLTYPEDEVPFVGSRDFEKIEKTSEDNALEAACNGAMLSGKVIAAVLLNVIAFLSLLKFVNATLLWLGERANVQDLTFEYICSYVLYPVALFMGAETDDCRKIGMLIGVKTFTNEFIAYQRLATILQNRVTWQNYTVVHGDAWHWNGDHVILENTNVTLKDGFVSRRSEVIATYALCGFSNCGSMGILLGSLSAMAPNRKPTLARLVLRAMIAGNIACFFTACVAGLFYEDFD